MKKFNLKQTKIKQDKMELTKFEICLLSAFNSVAGKAVMAIGVASFQEDVDEWSKPLLDLARKEILKDLPKWKKAKRNLEFKKHIVINEEDRINLTTEVYKGEYYIDPIDLLKLPKEE